MNQTLSSWNGTQFHGYNDLNKWAPLGRSHQSYVPIFRSTLSWESEDEAEDYCLSKDIFTLTFILFDELWYLSPTPFLITQRVSF